jgi:MFS family permease
MRFIGMTPNGIPVWNRDFLVALTGYYFLFMSVTLFFIYPLFFAPLGAPKTRIGLIMGIHSLTAILVRPFFGRLSDLRGRKNISVGGLLVLIVVTPFFHFVQGAGALPILLRALTGIGWGISMTATITICSDLAPVSRLAQSMGIIGVAGLLSAALGPLAAEEIVRRFGFGGLFNTSLLFLLISLTCMLATREVIKPKGKKIGDRSRLPRLALPVFLLIAILPTMHGAVRGTVVNFIALFSRSIPVGRIGPFFLTFSIAAIFTRLFFSDLSDEYGRKKILGPSILIISLNLVLISFAGSLWVLVLAGFIGGFGQGLIFPALSTYVIDTYGRLNKGFALSLYLTFFDVGMGLGSPLFGMVSDLWGYRWMYRLAGLMFAAAGGLFMWKAPDHGNGPETAG